MRELIDLFISLKKEKDEAENRLDEVKARLLAVQHHLSLLLMQNRIQSVAGSDGSLVYLTTKFGASVLDKEKFSDYCKSVCVDTKGTTLHDVLFVETVPSQTLTKYVRSLVELGLQIPPHVTVFYDIDVRLRKGSRRRNEQKEVE